VLNVDLVCCIECGFSVLVSECSGVREFVSECVLCG